MKKLVIKKNWFLDTHGRAVLLRGVNLGGSSKLPFGVSSLDPLDHDHEGLNHGLNDRLNDNRLNECGGAEQERTITFVGRPFPLSAADEHYRRLRHWGFNSLRFLTTWEAIEHRGPGQYDEGYLDYLYEVVRKAGDYGFAVFIDPHQDAWSRWSGGDGAPRWTLELVGFEPSRLDAAEAAITMSGRYPDYGTMIWPNNWGRLASCTMFTLFFAGRRLAPQCRLEGQYADDYLQEHFINAMRQVAKRLRDLPHVLGYDTLNEPSPGYIGIKNLADQLPVYNSAPQLSGFQSLYIPAGFSCEVDFITRQHLKQAPSHRVLLNPKGISAWRRPQYDIWRNHGVWDLDERGRPRLLQEHYFAQLRPFADCMLPFAKRFAIAMREEHPDAIAFIEGEPGASEPLSWDTDVPVVNASHWYDLLTLITKHYDPSAAMVWGSDATVQGENAVRQSFAAQIGAHVTTSRRYLDGSPTLIGEFGLAYDLDGGKAFQSGDFSAHESALGAYYDALDANLVHSTLWNYTADNNNRWGDGWNQEDLSIYSRDQAHGQLNANGDITEKPAINASIEGSLHITDINAGARALKGFCRPSVRACAGVPLRQHFSLDRQRFELDIEVDKQIVAPTLVYVPIVHFAELRLAASDRPANVWASSGRLAFDAATQILSWSDAEPGPQRLVITST